MNMHCEILKDVISALHTRGFLAIGSLEEELNAGFKLGIEPSQFAVHHSDDFVIVLQAQEDIAEAGQQTAE
jgi:hypothetical protein